MIQAENHSDFFLRKIIADEIMLLYDIIFIRTDTIWFPGLENHSNRSYIPSIIFPLSFNEEDNEQ